MSLLARRRLRPETRVRRQPPADTTGSPAIRRLIPALLAFVVVLVAGCSGGSSAGSRATAPDTAGAPAGLARFYGQHLSWRDCDGSFQCATLTVPLDYSKPHGQAIGVAVIRKVTDGTSRGSLIINPGGPGESGLEFLTEGASAFAPLVDHYDLVSFDPRGVGQSHPVRCLTSAQLDTFIDTNPAPTTAAQLATIVAQAKQFANACFAKNGSFLSHVGTIDQARDMDVLRAALGDRKLTYYGGSYGTYLGAKYAQLFPTRIRAMVLDGALDPDTDATEQNRVQANGFQTDLHDFLADCATRSSCPLGRTLPDELATLHGLEASLTRHPIAVGGRTLGAGEFFEGLAMGLYSPTLWPQLAEAIDEARQGSGSGILLFADSLTKRNSNGSYTNLVESNLAIDCIDRPSPRTVSAYSAAAKIAATTSPDFGAAIEYGLLPCAFWKVPPVESPHPVHAPGSPTILVIGTTRDPATPFVWAQALAKQLSKGVLLTFNGDGHGAGLRGDHCVDGAIRDYLESLKPPAPGTTCS